MLHSLFPHGHSLANVFHRKSLLADPTSLMQLGSTLIALEQGRSIHSKIGRRA